MRREKGSRRPWRGADPEKGGGGNSSGPRKDEEKSAVPWKALGLLAPYFKKHAGKLAMGFLCLIVVDFLQLWIPRVIKYAVDALERGTATPGLLLRHGATVVGLALVIGVLRFAWRHFIIGFSRLLETRLRERMFAHVLTLDRAVFQKRTVGELMALSTNDLSAVQLSAGIGLVALVDAVLMSLAAMGFMAYIHPGLTLIALAPMPVLAVFTRLLSARMHHRFNKVQEEFSRLTEFTRSSFSSIRLVKAYNQQEAQEARFDEMGRTYVRDNFRLAFVQGTLFPLSGLVSNTSLLLVVFFGGRLTIQGAITAGDFVAFMTYLFMLTWPMMAMGWVANLFQRGATSLERIRKLLDQGPLLRDPGGPAPPKPVQGRIRLERLSFAYPGYSQPVLRDVSLEIGEGILGVVGKTGSGKTTLCHLLARLYPVEKGTYFLDGEDVTRLPLAAVRSAVAYVPQDVVLFSRSIAENIALGKPGASPSEIEAVARAAAIHEEIVEMDRGYDTRIGEKGVMLSGGQRQRLAIARALLLDRPVILIDDGLSAVDMETEHAIVRSIARYLRGRTCVIVSHRVAPLADAHRIVVLEEGRIAASGTHEQLLEASPFYATIHRQQTLCADIDSPRAVEGASRPSP